MSCCVLATVRSTGTRFTFRLLEPHFRQRPCKYRIAPWTVYHSHTETGQLACLKNKARKLPLLLTMRDPTRVAHSWIRRGWPLDDNFKSQWRNLFALQAEFNGLWLPIDTDDRDMRLRAISRRLGVDLQTDWTPYEVTQVSKPYITGMTVAEAVEWLKKLPFEQFGYSL